MPRFSATVPTLILAAILVATAIGCDGCEWFDRGPSPWEFTSDEADYRLIFPGQWQAEPAESVNPHADVAASIDGELFVMVIPQQLPSFPDPDVFDLKDAALDMLDDSVDNLVVERQGPVELDGVSGMSVIATGEVDGEPTRYVTCYAVRDGVGYQVVSFAREDRASKLFEEVDTLLAGWQFTDDIDIDDPDELPDTTPGDGPLERDDAIPDNLAD